MVAITIFGGLLLGLIIRQVLKKEVRCKDCGFTGKLNKRNAHNELILILLLLCFILPGIIYAIWGSSNRYYKCPNCGGKNLIPANSPIFK